MIFNKSRNGSFYFKFFDKIVDKRYFLLYNEYRNKEQGEKQ